MILYRRRHRKRMDGLRRQQWRHQWQQLQSYCPKCEMTPTSTALGVPQPKCNHSIALSDAGMILDELCAPIYPEEEL